jgi:polyisoprenoid-binding protein YceI
MKNSYAVIIFFIFMGLGICHSNAREIISFGPQEATIDGIIPYTVIGKYKAQFNVFKGRVVLDETSQLVQSVYLEIEVSSIHSNCAWCDKVARSRRLLHAARYPKIIFKSDKIIHDGGSYMVKGVLEMHGIKKRMSFPFSVEMKRRWFDLKGSWIINRKDFNILWSKVLDHGGVLVGDNFTVNWEINSTLLKIKK